MTQFFTSEQKSITMAQHIQVGDMTASLFMVATYSKIQIGQIAQNAPQNAQKAPTTRSVPTTPKAPTQTPLMLSGPAQDPATPPTAATAPRNAPRWFDDTQNIVDITDADLKSGTHAASSTSQSSKWGAMKNWFTPAHSSHTHSNTPQHSKGWVHTKAQSQSQNDVWSRPSWA